jgi:DNA-binding CsgD family transcriptional regulator
MQTETEPKPVMSLTEREREILKLKSEGLSDYAIGRRIGADPPSVNRSRKNATEKLRKAQQDLAWAQGLNLKF